MMFTIQYSNDKIRWFDWGGPIADFRYEDLDYAEREMEALIFHRNTFSWVRIIDEEGAVVKGPIPANEHLFWLDLDEIFEDLWHEMERIQDGKFGHRIAIEAEDLNAAARKLAERLVGFFGKRMYLADERGRRPKKRKGRKHKCVPR